MKNPSPVGVTDQILSESTPPKNVLAIVVTRIGDTLLCTPALRALKETWPDCRLTVVAHSERGSVLRGLSFIDELKGFHHWHCWMARWRRTRKFDLAFLFHGDQEKLNYARKVASHVFSDPIPGAKSDGSVTFVPVPASPLAAVDDRLRIVRFAGADTNCLRLSYAVSDAEKNWARKFLDKHKVCSRGPRIAIQLKGFPTKSNRDWPFEFFKALVGRIINFYPDSFFLITGDRDSKADATELKKHFPGKILDTTGQCSLRETTSLIGQMDLYIGPDTGPTHLAGALQVPMVGIYRAAVPSRFMTPFEHPMFRAIDHPRSGAPNPHDAAMDEITVDSVWMAVEDLLIRSGFCPI